MPFPKPKYDKNLKQELYDRISQHPKNGELVSLAKSKDVPVSLVYMLRYQKAKKEGWILSDKPPINTPSGRQKSPFKPGYLVTIMKCVQHGALHNGETGRFLKKKGNLYRVRLNDRSLCDAFEIAEVGNEEIWHNQTRQKQERLALESQLANVKVSNGGRAYQLKTQKYDLDVSIFADNRIRLSELPQIVDNEGSYSLSDIEEVANIFTKIVRLAKGID